MDTREAVRQLMLGNNGYNLTPGMIEDATDAILAIFAEEREALERERDEWKRAATLDAPDRLLLAYAKEAQAEAREAALREALESVKRGACWCEMAVNNPMVNRHSDGCDKARTALAKVKEGK